jgi:hypothetical protein
MRFFDDQGDAADRILAAAVARRLREEWAQSAWLSLQNCDPSDAARVCLGYLEVLTIGDDHG